jgi:hypothetical protein
MAERPQNRNLRPFKKGDVGNPEGRNQYTYRREFEEAIARLAKGKLLDGELEALNLPDFIAHLIDSSEEMTRGEIIAFVTMFKAMQGGKDGLSEALARLWQKIERVEHDYSVADNAALIDRLASIARSRGANGSGGEPDDGGTAGAE